MSDVFNVIFICPNYISGKSRRYTVEPVAVFRHNIPQVEYMLVGLS